MSFILIDLTENEVLHLDRLCLCDYLFNKFTLAKVSHVLFVKRTVCLSARPRLVCPQISPHRRRPSKKAISWNCIGIFHLPNVRLPIVCLRNVCLDDISLGHISRASQLCLLGALFLIKETTLLSIRVQSLLFLTTGGLHRYQVFIEGLLGDTLTHVLVPVVLLASEE